MMVWNLLTLGMDEEIAKKLDGYKGETFADFVEIYQTEPNVQKLVEKQFKIRQIALFTWFCLVLLFVYLVVLL